MSSSSMAGAARELYESHPLQRLSSPSRGMSAAIHIASLSCAAYSFKYLVDNPTPINESYGWHMQFLTIIGLTLATITFFFGLVADMTLSPTIFQIKNAFSMTSTPMEVLISLLYWSLHFIDPKLVVPDWLPKLPIASDISFHLAPAAFLTIDLLLLSPPWTISATPALGLSCVIAAVYWLWIEQCYAHNGFYPYPIFEIEPKLRVGLFAGSAVLMTSSTLMLKWLYTRVNLSVPHIREDKSTPGDIKA